MNDINGLPKLGNTITDNLLDGIPLRNLSNIMSSYSGTDWRDYIVINKMIPYSKNCAYKNDHIEIIIITWNSNNSSKIHDHPENGCLLRIMEGSLVEDVYIIKNDGLICIGRNELKFDQISYKVGDKYLHKISNIDDTYYVSLHIYSPPNYKIKYYDQNI